MKATVLAKTSDDPMLVAQELIKENGFIRVTVVEGRRFNLLIVVAGKDRRAIKALVSATINARQGIAPIDFTQEILYHQIMVRGLILVTPKLAVGRFRPLIEELEATPGVTKVQTVHQPQPPSLIVFLEGFSKEHLDSIRTTIQAIELVSSISELFISMIEET